MKKINGTEPRLIVYKSRKKGVAITVCGFLLGIAGGLVLQYTDDEVLGWCLVIAAAFTAILGIGTLSDREPQLVITQHGITEPYIIKEEIEWNAVLHADDFFFRGQSFVRILLDKNYKPGLIRPAWFWRLDRIYGKEGIKAAYIRASNLDVNSRQLVSIIDKMVKSDDRERYVYLQRLITTV